MPKGISFPWALIHCATDTAHDEYRGYCQSPLIWDGDQKRSRRHPRPIRREVESYAGRIQIRVTDGTSLDSAVVSPSSWPKWPSEVSYRSENT